MQNRWEKFKEIRTNYPNSTDTVVLPMSILFQRIIQQPSIFTDNNRRMLNDRLQQKNTTLFDKLTIAPVNNHLENERRPLDNNSYQEINKGMDLASRARDMKPVSFFSAYSKQQYNIGTAFGKSGEKGGQALHYALGFASKFLEGMANPVRAERNMLLGGGDDD